jgi:hypothetical protein
MPTSNRLVFPRSLTSKGVTSRTAVYGPVRTVVWQGSVGDHRPYADLVGNPSIVSGSHVIWEPAVSVDLSALTSGCNVLSSVRQVLLNATFHPRESGNDCRQRKNEPL